MGACLNPEKGGGADGRHLLSFQAKKFFSVVPNVLCSQSDL